MGTHTLSNISCLWVKKNEDITCTSILLYLDSHKVDKGNKRREKKLVLTLSLIHTKRVKITQKESWQMKCY
jgi:hypothetical protein